MTDVTPTRRVLLCATTTGYQTRSFDEAAAELGIELVLATDRCDHLDDPWRDRAIPVRFHDEAASCAAVLDALGTRRLDGVIAVGDRPVVVAALVAERRGVPWHQVDGARASRDKRLFRERMLTAGLPGPWSRTVSVGAGPEAARRRAVPVRRQAAGAVGQPGRHSRRRPAKPGRGGGPSRPHPAVVRCAGAARSGRRPDPDRRIRPGIRGGARGRPGPRHAARAGGVRQARSARRPLLRRDHVRHPDVARRRRAGAGDRRR